MKYIHGSINLLSFNARLCITAFIFVMFVLHGYPAVASEIQLENIYEKLEGGFDYDSRLRELETIEDAEDSVLLRREKAMCLIWKFLKESLPICNDSNCTGMISRFNSGDSPLPYFRASKQSGAERRVRKEIMETRVTLAHGYSPVPIYPHSLIWRDTFPRYNPRRYNPLTDGQL